MNDIAKLQKQIDIQTEIITLQQKQYKGLDHMMIGQMFINILTFCIILVIIKRIIHLQNEL